MSESTTALHTLTWGETGSRVLFLHGLFGQGRNWGTVAKAIAGRHRATGVDLPDHGRSPWSGEIDYLAMASRVAELIDAQDPAAVVGHSMGGKVAMALALTRPELVSRLLVADMSPVDYRRAGEFRRYISAMQGLDLDRIERRSDAEEQLAAEVHDDTVRSFLLQNLRRRGDGWEWQANLDLLDRDLATVGGWPAERLTGVAPYQGPVLWLGGGRSDYVTDEYAEPMRRWFPHYRRVTMKDTGHWVHSERPELFVEILRRFLGDPTA
ncbi:alpha/beta fold hydrolase [Nocardioides insulae]|uniref:alpha/beta fold hydrolase n=1 Tax=Nocardioides insulae TaxID=394734 RepID=UPI0003F949DC|nr:alpha/beta fold hydrolase [Nocardioides insulae]